MGHEFFKLIIELIMKEFSPGGRGLFNEDSAPTYKAQGFTEWFKEDKNAVNCVIGNSQ